MREPTVAERLNAEVWSAGDLLERLERCDKFFVLDVRNRDEFERFRLEGRSPVPAVNIPYFEMLELGGKDEMLDSVVAYVERDLADQLPSDLPILAVCAKGDTSEFVAEGRLRRNAHQLRLVYPSLARHRAATSGGTGL
jgi:rhodanese-related sulfurtransferase